MTPDPHLLRSQLTGHQLLDHQLLDHQGLDLDAARRVTYVIEQSFRYEYDAPVRSLRQRLVSVPPGRHGGQHRRACQLEVAGAQARRRLLRDRNGNVVTWLRAEHVAQAVEFRLTAIVERIRRDGPAVLPREALVSPALLSPTRLTAADDRLRDLAARLPATAAAPLDQAEWICDLVHASLEYADGVTSVRTTAAEALAGGRGVCQDMAHVMLALCHLVPRPPGGQRLRHGRHRPRLRRRGADLGQLRRHVREPADRPAPGRRAGRRLTYPGGGQHRPSGARAQVRLPRMMLPEPWFTTGRPVFGSRRPLRFSPM